MGFKRLVVRFQFHYGTIKAVTAELEKLADVKFQFHYGTIKACAGPAALWVAIFISIPLRYD